MEKPLNLRIEEIRNEIASTINGAKLPAYILKPVIKDFYNQLENLERQELIQAQKDYEDSLKRKEDNQKEKKETKSET